MNKYQSLLQNSSFSLAISLLTLCIVGSYPFLTQLNEQLSTSINETSHDPDVFATKVTAFYLNKDGKLQTEFKSPKMLHYAAQNRTEFDHPHFLIYTQNTTPWHIFALHGQAISGVDSITLWDNVHIHQDQSHTNHELNLHTNTMTLYPKTQMADTNQPVLLTQPGYQVSAVGVHVSLKEEKVDLMSNARGEFSAGFVKHPTK